MMIWMLYCALVALLLGLAAVLIERLLLLYGRSVRGVWLGALATSVLLPLVAAGVVTRRTAAGDTDATTEIPVIGPEIVLGDPASMAAPGAPGAIAWDTILGAGWVVASLVLLAWLLVSAVSLRRQRRNWRQAVVEGEEVRVSESMGPAVVGLFRSEIVVPGWVLELDPASRRSVIEHEVEHLRGRDPQILTAAMAALMLMPWNLPLWWHLHRLRLGIEVDCDRRVLARRVDPRKYALLLVEIARRVRQPPLSFAAFAEPRSFLERRIRIMTTRKPSALRSRAIALGLAGLILGAAAFAFPSPPAPEFAINSMISPQGFTPPTPGDIGSSEISHSGESPVAPVALAGPPETAAVPAPVLPAPVPVDTPVTPQPRIQDNPAFTPRTQDPRIPAEERRRLWQYLQENYPPALRQAGANPRTVLWVFIDEEGVVRNTRVQESSGYPAFDQLAQNALRDVQFTPALNRDRQVPVWIQLPISAEFQQEARAAAEEEPTPRPRAAATPTAPLAPGEQLADRPAFSPRTQEPELLNQAELSAAIQRAFPPALRAAGVGGRVVLWLFIDEEGAARNSRVAQSSGLPALDRAAQEAIAVARFAPARNRAEVVPVWIQIPISFSTE